MFPWLARRASWLLSRYLTHADGLASYAQRWGHTFEPATCALAETIRFRDTSKHVARLTSMWDHGLGLGRDTLANEVIVGTPQGIKVVRDVRRLIPSEKYSELLSDSVRGIPWSLRGDRNLEQFHFFFD